MPIQAEAIPGAPCQTNPRVNARVTAPCMPPCCTPQDPAAQCRKSCKCKQGTAQAAPPPPRSFFRPSQGHGSKPCIRLQTRQPGWGAILPLLVYHASNYPRMASAPTMRNDEQCKRLDTTNGSSRPATADLRSKNQSPNRSPGEIRVRIAVSASATQMFSSAKEPIQEGQNLPLRRTTSSSEPSTRWGKGPWF